jgi:transposase
MPARAALRGAPAGTNALSASQCRGASPRRLGDATTLSRHSSAAGVAPACSAHPLMSPPLTAHPPAPSSPAHRPQSGYKAHSFYPEIGGLPEPVMKPSSPRRSEPRPISDGLWAAIEPLIPPKERSEGKQFQRRPGAGRKPIPARKVFEAIIHVLRTGTPWKSLPRSVGSSSAIHRWFDAWHAAGFFHKLWAAGLAEHEEMEGIAWEWHLGEAASDVELGSSRNPFPDTQPSTPAAPSNGSVRPRQWQPSGVRRRRRQSK